MSPNIKELKLRDCKNLVEIDDSVGRLDKLEVWNLFNCVKLETFPSCLSMKSLRHFNLCGCYSLKKFPNISQEMRSLGSLNMRDTGILGCTDTLFLASCRCRTPERVRLAGFRCPAVSSFFFFFFRFSDTRRRGSDAALTRPTHQQ